MTVITVNGLKITAIPASGNTSTVEAMAKATEAASAGIIKDLVRAAFIVLHGMPRRCNPE